MGRTAREDQALPAGWRQAVAPDLNETYYFHDASGTRTLERPDNGERVWYMRRRVFVANAFVEAVGHNQQAAAQLLLDRGADPNLASNEGIAPLMAAAMQNFLLVLRLLIDANAELNAAEPDAGHTAFHYACAAGSADCAEETQACAIRTATRGGIVPRGMATRRCWSG